MDGFKVNTTSMHLVEAIVNCYAPTKSSKNKLCVRLGSLINWSQERLKTLYWSREEPVKLYIVPQKKKNANDQDYVTTNASM
jgi:hypothetical protein